MSGSIIGIGSAWPTPTAQSALWDGFFADHYDDARLARAAFRLSGVQARGGCIDPTVEDVSSWGTEKRMRRYVHEAMPLASAAVEAALDDAGREPADVDVLVTVSCTGYATPGIDVRLVEQLGMGAATQRVNIGHMGCFAAIPGLATVADAAAARGKTAVLVCVEVSSLHLQPRDHDGGSIMAHALFGDAAAAVVVEPVTSADGAASGDGAALGYEVVDVASRTDVEHAGHMTWDITDRGFRMGLSSRIPDLLGGHVGPLVDELLARHGLAPGDVDAWAVHPGGPRIVDVVGDRLGLDGRLDVSRQVLSEHGNTSSPTVLLILERLIRQGEVPCGGHVVCLAFGPGLTLYGALLRRTGGPTR